MKAIKEKNKYLMSFLIVILVACIVGIFLINKQIKKEKLEILEFKKMISENSSIAISPEKLKIMISEVDLKSEKMDKLYIHEDEIIKFIETLEGLAKSSKVEIEIGGVDVKKFEKTDKKNDKATVVEVEHNDLNMTISVKGDWTGVTNFLKQIEGLPYAIRIDSSKLNYSKDVKVDFWTLNFSLKVITN